MMSPRNRCTVRRPALRAARLARLALLGALLWTVAPSVALAQQPGRAGSAGFLVSRAELTRQLQELEAIAMSSSARSGVRRTAEEDAQRIRERLEEGDLRVGDQIVLNVAFEPTLNDTFPVSADRTLELPNVGSIPLAGVLRSELNEHLARELARYIRDPQVRATSLLRVTILGEVERPGFHVVDSHMLLTDVLTAAGGPTRNAALDRIRIVRSSRRVASGADVETAIMEGHTLDQLSLSAGDRIIVPQVRRATDTARWLIATIPPLVWLGVTIFR